MSHKNTNCSLENGKNNGSGSVHQYTIPENVETVEYVSSMNKNVISTDRGMKCRWGILEENPHSKVVNWKKTDPIIPNILHAIGNTKLVRLNKIPQSYGLKCEILAKCEFLNPGGSVKDRASLRMIENAEKEGLIKPGFTIIEATSGNTGIGVAMTAAVKGYRCIIIMNDNYALEKVSILKSLGAEVVRVPSTNKLTSPDGCLGTAMRLKQEIPNSIILDQFSNPGNSLSHYDNTAEEILDACAGKIDMMVCVAGTGGTISGVGRKIKERSPLTKVIGLDSHGSVLAPQSDLSQTGNFEVEGMGNITVPPVMDYKVVDKWFKIGNEEAFQMTRRLIKEEGLLVGCTSGASVVGAIKAAEHFELKEGHRVVVILSDNSRNYLSRFVCDNWMEMKRYKEVENRDHWWWNHTVGSLNLGPLKTVEDDRSIAAVFDEMRSSKVNEILVVDKSSGNLRGVCELKTVLQKLNGSLVKKSDPVAKVTNASPTVRTTDSLGLVARILEIEHLVAVVHEKDKTGEPCGIIRQGDFLNFIIHKS